MKSEEREVTKSTYAIDRFKKSQDKTTTLVVTKDYTPLFDARSTIQHLSFLLFVDKSPFIKKSRF